MSYLIGLPPDLLDQSFPRDDQEYARVAAAFGEILAGCQTTQTFSIVALDIFDECISSVDWSGGYDPRLMDIYRFLSLVAEGRDWVIDCEHQHETAVYPHPVPAHCSNSTQVLQKWQHEMAQVLTKHDRHSKDGEFRIGIVCTHTFAGLPAPGYPKENQARCFPLVGPDDCRPPSQTPIKPAFTYSVPDGYVPPPITFQCALRSVQTVFGATVANPRNGSHYIVNFPNATRPWPLDPNNANVLPQYLNQLKSILDLPGDVIRYALAEGQLPPRVWFFAN